MMVAILRRVRRIRAALHYFTESVGLDLNRDLLGEDEWSRQRAALDRSVTEAPVTDMPKQREPVARRTVKPGRHAGEGWL